VLELAAEHRQPDPRRSERKAVPCELHLCGAPLEGSRPFQIALHRGGLCGHEERARVSDARGVEVCIDGLGRAVGKAENRLPSRTDLLDFDLDGDAVQAMVRR
jgi:hypothetical protein